jgi:hypothetical protein
MTLAKLGENMIESKIFATISVPMTHFRHLYGLQTQIDTLRIRAGVSMLAKREPSRPAHFEYCPAFGAGTASCSTVLRGEVSRRKTRKGRTFADDQPRPPGMPNLQRAVSSVFSIPS